MGSGEAGARARPRGTAKAGAERRGARPTGRCMGLVRRAPAQGAKPPVLALDEPEGDAHCLELLLDLLELVLDLGAPNAFCLNHLVCLLGGGVVSGTCRNMGEEKRTSFKSARETRAW